MFTSFIPSTVFGKHTINPLSIIPWIDGTMVYARNDENGEKDKAKIKCSYTNVLKVPGYMVESFNI